MLNKPNARQWLQHLAAIVVFLAVTLMYFAPMLEGKKIRQYDIANWQGMSKEIVDYRAKHNSEPLWTNSMFGGMPAYQISVFYNANVARYVDKILTLGLPSDAGYAFLCFLGFYFLLVTLGVDKGVAVFGGLAFGFSSYFFIFIETGHTAKVHAIGYMAPVAAGVIMCYRKNILAGAVIAGLALSLEIYTNHLQITYYLMMLILVFVITEIYRTVKEKLWGNFIKASSALLVAVVFAVLSNITTLWATYEYGKHSTRGPSDLTITDAKNRTSGLDKDYAVDWSYGISESLTLIIPNAKGGGSGRIGDDNKDALDVVSAGEMRQVIANQDQYWGDQAFTAGPEYAGAIACLLFIAGFIFVKGPLRWWLLGGTVMSLLLAWGKNFMPLTEFFLDNVPGYNKFRAVSTMIIVAAFCIPLLAALTLDRILKNPDIITESKKKIKWVIGGLMGLVIFMTAFPASTGLRKTDEYEKTLQAVKQGQPNATESQITKFLNDMMPELEAVRAKIFQTDALRTLLFMAVTIGFIWAYWKMKFDKRFFIAGMVLLVLLDMLPVARRYLDKKDFVSAGRVNVPFEMTQSDQMIKEDPSPSYRVLNVAANTYNDASTSYYHQSIGGYHGAKLKRYKELIDYYLGPATAHIQNRLEAGDVQVRGFIENHPVLNMLNTKYVIYSPQGGIIRNDRTFGNAWFVKEYQLVANADSELMSLQKFNPGITAIIDKRFSNEVKGLTLSPEGAGQITLESYQPNHLVYTSNAGTEQLAVFSEIYYDKGWNAYVDGKLTPHFRADFVLRAMRVPAGNHKIEFKFEPKVYGIGEKISFASSLILLLACAGVAFMEIRKKKAAKTV